MNGNIALIVLVCIPRSNCVNVSSLLTLLDIKVSTCLAKFSLNLKPFCFNTARTSFLTLSFAIICTFTLNKFSLLFLIPSSSLCRVFICVSISIFLLLFISFFARISISIKDLSISVSALYLSIGEIFIVTLDSSRLNSGYIHAFGTSIG